MDPALGTLIEHIGARFALERAHVNNYREMREFWAAADRYRGKPTRANALRIRGFLARFPDLGIRLCRLVGEPHTMAPRDNAPGVFSLPAELVRQHLLPLIGYRALGRLAQSSSGWRAVVGPQEFAGAMERFVSHRYSEVERLTRRQVRLWTTDEHQVVLHAIAESVPGLVYGGRNYVGTSRLNNNTVFTSRWPPETRDVDRNFEAVFRDLTTQRLLACAIVRPVMQGSLLLELYLRGVYEAMMENGVLKFTIEFFPSTWGPAI